MIEAPAEPEAFGADDGDWGGYGGGWSGSTSVAQPSAAPPSAPMGGARADYTRYRALSALPRLKQIYSLPIVTSNHAALLAACRALSVEPTGLGLA